MVLPCSLSMCFFCPFSILITLLGEEGAGICAYRALFVSYTHVNLCQFFFPPGVKGWLRILLFLDFSVYLFVNIADTIKVLR